jgi:hypothetical protein
MWKKIKTIYLFNTRFSFYEIDEKWLMKTEYFKQETMWRYFFNFVQLPANAQLFHKLSHPYMFRYYRFILFILRELVTNALQVTQVFQVQLLVIQFIIKMFPIGFMQVIIL